jgi:hypothetical protein
LFGVLSTSAFSPCGEMLALARSGPKTVQVFV